jgi:dCTP deaminase
MIEGRSSIGRLGLFVHVTAGFGDVGFRGYWTLEMFAVQPIRIDPGVPICQIFYHQIAGEIREYNSDKYQNNRDIQPSLLFKELNPDCTGPDPAAFRVLKLLKRERPSVEPIRLHGGGRIRYIFANDGG